MGQDRPRGQVPAHRIGCIRTVCAQQPLDPQFSLDLGRHAMIWILNTRLGIPKMMGDEFQEKLSGAVLGR